MKRANSGVDAEDLIASRFLRISKFVDINRNHGVDLIVKISHKSILVEVKSAHYRVKGGKGSPYRKGAFYFYPQNISRPDFYAFVIYYKMGDKKVPKTYWVRKEEIGEYFKDREVNTKLSLGIPTLLNKIKHIDFGEVIK